MSVDTDTRALLARHWQASEEGDAEAEHAIYAPDAVLDYPQSGERFRGRDTIRRQRGGHPAERHFEVRRLMGAGDLWLSECVITYDGAPTFSVSIMEFAETGWSRTRRSTSPTRSPGAVAGRRPSACRTGEWGFLGAPGGDSNPRPSVP